MSGVRNVMRLWAMGGQHEPAERIEALRGLLERLSAPDLTLADSKDLRDRVQDLLASDSSVTPTPAVLPPRGRPEGALHEVWPVETSIRAAG
jgi:hypothetical protein